MCPLYPANWHMTTLKSTNSRCPSRLNQSLINITRLPIANCPAEKTDLKKRLDHLHNHIINNSKHRIIVLNEIGVRVIHSLFFMITTVLISGQYMQLYSY